ncbi:hypothetical protein ODU73_002348 [Thermoclostridium stercorarium]|uniref:hypothetical protein n=1 Tax=Thermoclostridium stercorarium TaxID=1510 RepID=UPI0022487E35|nr:hypothetical protein [Thermoclostridium stercorarium]UZQ87012.1 hypothetical protein ODU73_002348 [Thermoclostridium stercorarium]
MVKNTLPIKHKLIAVVAAILKYSHVKPELTIGWQMPEKKALNIKTKLAMTYREKRQLLFLDRNYASYLIPVCGKRNYIKHEAV